MRGSLYLCSSWSLDSLLVCTAKNIVTVTGNNDSLLVVSLVTKFRGTECHNGVEREDFCFSFFHCEIRGTECNNGKAFVFHFFTVKLGNLNFVTRGRLSFFIFSVKN